MTKIRSARRVSSFADSVFGEMTRLAKLHNAVNLSQGFPDFEAPQAIKVVFGQYDAVSVIQNRGKFNADAAAALAKSADGPVTIDSVQIENIDFSDAYEQAGPHRSRCRRRSSSSRRKRSMPRSP